MLFPDRLTHIDVTPHDFDPKRKAELCSVTSRRLNDGRGDEGDHHARPSGAVSARLDSAGGAPACAGPTASSQRISRAMKRGADGGPDHACRHRAHGAGRGSHDHATRFAGHQRDLQRDRSRANDHVIRRFAP